MAVKGRKGLTIWHIISRFRAPGLLGQPLVSAMPLETFAPTGHFLGTSRKGV